MAVPVPRGTIILVALAAATVAAAGIAAVRGILAPTLLALVLTMCVSPLREGLARRGVPAGVAAGAGAVVVLVLLAGFSYAIVVAFGRFLTMLPTYDDEFAALGDDIARGLAAMGIGQPQVEQLLRSIDPGHLAEIAAGAVGGVFSLTGAVVIVVTMIILMAGDAIYARATLAQIAEHRPDAVEALSGFTVNVRRYMVVTAGLGLVQGALNTLALVLLQVPAALLWGLLAFLCSFIPNVGYFFAIIPPLVFGYLVGGWQTVIGVAVVYALINGVVQSVVQPRVVGNAVSLSQTLTFFSVLFWAVVIGPIGAILAVPLTLLARAVLLDSDPAAHLWRPALGPTDATRTLTRDADRAARASARRRRPRPG